MTVVDGPFTETKEVIGGFALIQVASKEEALEWTKRFLEVAGDGESEIRLLHEAPVSVAWGVDQGRLEAAPTCFVTAARRS